MIGHSLGRWSATSGRKWNPATLCLAGRSITESETMSSSSSDSGISRMELYEQIWSTPPTKVAEQLGVPFYLFVKACKNHRIPRPPPGYWARLRHGKKEPKKPLPTIDDPSREKVVFPEPQSPPLHLRSAGDASSEDVAPDIPVPDQLADPHPLIEATRRHMKSKTPESDHIVRGASEQTLDVNVSRQALNRTLCIMDSLLKHWEQLGGTVRIRRARADSQPETLLSLKEDGVEVAVNERLQRIRKRQIKTFLGSTRWEYTSCPSGKLEFVVSSAYGSGVRSTWADGERQRLEDILGSVIQGLLDHIEHNRGERLDRECRERQKARAMELRTWRKKAHEDEEGRRKRLMSLLEHRRTAIHIRELVALARRAVDGGGLSVLPDVADATWQEWALWYADRLDPFARAGECPIQDGPPGPVNTPLEKVDLTRDTRQAMLKLDVKDSDGMAQLSKKEVERVLGWCGFGMWDEVCDALAGMGYDTPVSR